MEGIQWRIELREPTDLTPNSTIALVFYYSNQNEYPHHIRSVSIAGTWDLENKSTKIVDIVVLPGKTRKLPPVEIKTPTGIGGKQGIQFGSEVRRYDTDSNTDYKQLWSKSLLRRGVRNSDVYRPLFCVSGDNGDGSIIRELVHNWGFDIREVYAQEEVSDLFKEKEEIPIAVFGVILPNDSANDSNKHLVSSAATTATLFDETFHPVIFKHTNAVMPDLPNECIEIEFDPNDEIGLEEAAGPVLLSVRHLAETGRVAQFIEKSKGLGGKTLMWLLSTWVGYITLSATGVDDTTDELIDKIGEEGREIVAAEDTSIDGWQMYRCNATRTGHIPDEIGPIKNPTQRWTFETGRLVSSSPAVVNGTVYIGSTDQNVYALDAATGRQQWTFEIGKRVSSSPAVVNGTVYIGGAPTVPEDEKVYALDAATGRQRWTFETGKRVYSSPAVANGTVYIGSGRNVYALDAATGRQRWTFETGYTVFSSPAVANGTVYIGSKDNNVYALDAATGRQQWTFETGKRVKSSPAVANGTVYIGSSDHNVYALDAATGRQRWTFETGGNVPSSPAVVNGTVYIGSSDYNVYALTE